MRLPKLWTLLCFCAIASNAIAGIGPENVAVVVNGDSVDSLTVANAYALLRGIPQSNFVVLHHVTGTETTDVEHFRKEILQLVLDTLRDRGLTAQIDCITYSVDLPYSVDVNGDVKGRKLPLVITPTASINGLTYLEDWVLKDDIDYLRLDVNRYARRQLPIPAGIELSTAEQAEYADALDKYEKKDYAGAVKVLSKLLETPRNDTVLTYNFACLQALAGQPDDALASLHKAIADGYRNYAQVAAEPDLVSLRDNDDFKKILRILKSATIEVQEGVAFRRSLGWNRAGEPDPSGAHYMLSTMLGVTTGRGNTMDEVLACLRRDQAADFTSPKGTIYFERNGDVRSTTREWGFQPAVDALLRLGVNAVVEDGVLPQNRNDVAGAMIGISDFDWPASHNTILPGAICEHFTSFGGVLAKGAGQTPCSVFIRAGAAGTSGVVTEPYALQEKFPTPFIQVQYAKGFTLAESFYQSLYGPYQLLIIGDPLCRPWAKKVEVKVANLKPGASITGVMLLTPSVAPAVPVAMYQLFVDGKLLKTAKPGEPLSLDSRSLCEGYHEVSVVAELANQPASQYRMVVPVSVPHDGVNVIVSTDSAVHSNGEVNFHLSSKWATKIDLYSLGEVIGTLNSDTGTVLVKSSVLGRGAAKVYPVATYMVGGKPVRVTGRPITVGQATE